MEERRQNIQSRRFSLKGMRRRLRLSIVLLVIVFCFFSGIKHSFSGESSVSSGSSVSGGRLVAGECCKPCCSKNFAEAVRKKRIEEGVRRLKKLTHWSEIVNAFEFVRGTFSKYVNSFEEKLSTLLGIKHGGTDEVIRLEAIIITAKREAKAAKEEARLTTKSSVKKKESSSTVLCNTVTANQGVISAYWFALAVQNSVSQAIEGLFIDQNFGGLAIKRVLYDLSCPPKDEPWFEGDPKTMNPAKNPPEKCKADNEAFIDANISSRILSGEMPLELPPLVEKTYTMPDGTKKTFQVPIPDKKLLENDENGIGAEKYEAQQRFKLAMKYCILAALGERKPPPFGDQMETAEGIVKTVEWTKRASQNTSSIEECARRIARHTRPNCKDETAGICGDSIIACGAATSLGADLSFNCRHPMTLAQAEEAAVKACFGREKALWQAADTAGGVKQQDLTEQSAQCMQLYGYWQSLVEEEKKGFQITLAAAEKMDKLWPQEEIIGTSQTQRGMAKSSPGTDTKKKEEEEEKKDKTKTVVEPTTIEPSETAGGEGTTEDNETTEGGSEKPGTTEMTPEQRQEAENILEQLVGKRATDVGGKYDCSGTHYQIKTMQGFDIPRTSAHGYYLLALQGLYGMSLGSLDNVSYGDGIAIDKDGDGIMDHISTYFGEGFEKYLGEGKNLLNSPGNSSKFIGGQSLSYYLQKYGGRVYVIKYRQP